MEANLQTVEYLDVLFDLKNNTFKPYRKPNNDPLYISMKSNHPPSVLKHIPKGIGKRLSEVSSSEEIFKEAVPLYEDALKASGFDEKLVFTNNNANRPQYRRNRRRKIIWYNPPYSSNVKTNIGKVFLRLITTHFHKQHVLHKVFNRNTVKISYSCMRNISAVISSHNKSMMRKDATPVRECNCPNKDECPLDNKCLSSNIIYEAQVTSQPENVVKHYRGLCSTDFKARLAVHHQCMNHRRYAKGCELSKYVWELKDSNREYDIKWKLLKQVKGRKVGGVCKLCTTEKLYIVEHPNKDMLLNSNCIQKCRHEAKYMLSRYGEKPGRNDTMD